MKSEGKFRLALGLLLVGFVAHRAYYTRKNAPTLEENPSPSPPSQTTAEPAHPLPSLLGPVALAATGIYLLSPRRMAWASLPLPAAIRWGGLIPAGAGFLLLQWSHQALGRNWSDQPRIKEGQTLTTEGPYRRIRHPIYSAFLLILSAPLWISANWFIGLSWLGMAVSDILARMRYEEDLMLAQFGDDYRAYMDRTGRLIPRLSDGKVNTKTHTLPTLLGR